MPGRGHEVLLAQDGLFEKRLRPRVLRHEQHVAEVEDEKEAGLVHVDMLVPEEHVQHEQVEGVPAAVSEQRPPGQHENLLGEERARSDDEEHVEHRTSDDGTEPDVRLGDEHADERGEELGGASTRGHKRGAGDVVLNLVLFHQHLQRGDEEVVADDGDAREGVHDADDVQHDGSFLHTLFTERVVRIQRTFFREAATRGRRRPASREHAPVAPIVRR